MTDAEPRPLPADITTPATALALCALDAAPTLLENFFWGMVLGYPGAAELYFEELAITDLRGPGHLTDDEPGELEAREP